MKTIYTAPKATSISLHIEDAILTLSKGENFVNDAISNGAQLSNQHGWSSDNWTATEED